MNEKVLGHFFRYRRKNANVEQFPVSQNRKRRTSGLTREEVAALAHVSTDWYTRIEQGRTGAAPSAEVLESLCTALKLDQSEINYVFNLAGFVPPARPIMEVNQSIFDWLNVLDPHPAFAIDRNMTIIAANQGYEQVYHYSSEVPPLKRNWIYRVFQEEYYRENLISWEHYAVYLTSVFRQLCGQNADSPFLLSIFQALKSDPTFLDAWNQLSVCDFEEQRIILNTVPVGDLYLVESVMKVPSAEQYLVMQNAGDAVTERKLRLLVR